MPCRYDQIAVGDENIAVDTRTGHLAIALRQQGLKFLFLVLQTANRQIFMKSLATFFITAHSPIEFGQRFFGEIAQGPVDDLYRDTKTVIDRAQGAVDGQGRRQHICYSTEDPLSGPHPHRPGNQEDLGIGPGEFKDIGGRGYLTIIKEHQDIAALCGQMAKRPFVHAPAVTEDDQAPTIVSM